MLSLAKYVTCSVLYCCGGAKKVAILKEFVPEQLSDVDIEVLSYEAITSNSASARKDKVMSLLKAKADMGAVSTKIKAKLA